MKIIENLISLRKYDMLVLTKYVFKQSTSIPNLQILDKKFVNVIKRDDRTDSIPFGFPENFTK